MENFEDKLRQLITSLEQNIDVMKRDLAVAKEYLEKIQQNQATTSQSTKEELELSIDRLQSRIWQQEDELKEKRSKVQSHFVSPSAENEDSIQMMERMKRKVEADEQLAKLYEEIAQSEGKIDNLSSEINKAVKEAEKAAASDALAELKAKMGIKK